MTLRGLRGFLLALALQLLAGVPYLSLLPVVGASASYVLRGERAGVLVWAVERGLHIAVEPVLSAWFLGLGGAGWRALVDWLYVWPHVALMALGWLALWIWRRGWVWYYLAIWGVMEVVWNVCGLCWPVAPPRLTPGVVQHVVAAPAAYDAYVAMPSFHVALALLVAAVFSEAWPRLWWLWQGYGWCMCVWVVLSGNHWLLDVAGGALLYGLARALVDVVVWELLGFVGVGEGVLVDPESG